MRRILFTLLALSSVIYAAPKRELNPKLAQILTSLIQDVLMSEKHKTARIFYGTPEDKTVILLDGGGFGEAPVAWPEGFAPKIGDFTFVFGRLQPSKAPQDLAEYQVWNSKRNRILAIRLDRLDFNPKSDGTDKGLHPMFLSPIRVSIQNGGGTKNGVVIGGQTTWYDIERSDGGVWSVVMKGAIN